MSDFIDSLMIKIGVDTSALSQGMAQAQQTISDAGEKMSGAANEAAGAFSGLGDKIASAMNVSEGFEEVLGRMVTAFGVVELAMKASEAVMDGLKFDAMIQANQAVIEAFMGSAEKAQEAIENLQSLERSSPLQFNDLAGAEKTLLAFGVSANEVSDVMKQLTVVSSALSVPIGTLADIYGRIESTGTATQRDILQLQRDGIPIYQALEAVTGDSVDQIKELAKQGGLTAQMMQDAFTRMTETGSKLSDAYVAQQGTMKASTDQLGKAWEEFLGYITSGFVKPATDAANFFTTVLDGITNADKAANAWIRNIDTAIADFYAKFLTDKAIIAEISSLFTGQKLVLDEINTKLATSSVQYDAMDKINKSIANSLKSQSNTQADQKKTLDTFTATMNSIDQLQKSGAISQQQALQDKIAAETTYKKTLTDEYEQNQISLPFVVAQMKAVSASENEHQTTLKTLNNGYAILGDGVTKVAMDADGLRTIVKGTTTETNAQVKSILDSSEALQLEYDGLKNIEQISSDISDLSDVQKNKIIDESEILERDLNPELNTIQNLLKQLSPMIDLIIKKSDDWSRVTGSVEDGVNSIWENGFEAIGAALVNNTDAWQAWQGVALEALASVLDAFGNQLTAIAVADGLMGNYAGAATAAAGAAAAFVASGVLSALASQMNHVASSANAASSAMTAAFGDLITTVTKQLVGGGLTQTIGDLGTKISSVQDQISDVTSKINTLKKNGIVTSAEGMELSALNQQLDGLNSTLSKYQAQLDATKTAQEDWIETTYNNMYLDIVSAKQTISAYQLVLTSASYASLVFRNNLDGIAQSAASFSASLGSLGTDITKTLVDNLEQGLTESDFMASMKTYITNLVIQTAVYTDSLESELASIGQKIAAGIASGMSSSDMTDLVDQLKGVYETASKNATTAAQVVSAAFSGSIDSPATASTSLTQNQQSIVSAIQGYNDQINKLNLALLTTDVGNASLLSSDQASIVTAQQNLAISTAQARVAKIPGYELGTDFAPGGIALVGESGPELVKLPRGSQVIPADRTAGMMSKGAGSQSFTYNHYSPVQVGPAEAARVAKRTFQRMAWEAHA